MVNVNAIPMLTQPDTRKVILAILHRSIVVIEVALPSVANPTDIFDFCLPCCFARIAFRPKVIALSSDFPSVAAEQALSENIHSISLGVWRHIRLDASLAADEQIIEEVCCPVSVLYYV